MFSVSCLPKSFCVHPNPFLVFLEGGEGTGWWLRILPRAKKTEIFAPALFWDWPSTSAMKVKRDPFPCKCCFASTVWQVIFMSSLEILPVYAQYWVSERSWVVKRKAHCLERGVSPQELLPYPKGCGISDPLGGLWGALTHSFLAPTCCHEATSFYSRALASLSYSHLTRPSSLCLLFHR